MLPFLADAILVIEDDAHIRRSISNALGHLSERIMEAGTAAQGIELAATARPDLIVLDLGLPDIQGDEVCRELRQWTSAPIVVLSARHEEGQKVRLLTLGADDYVTKPFSRAEFVARIQAHLRRTHTPPHQVPSPVVADGLSVDLGLREVRRDGTLIRLTRTEWLLTQALASHAGRTLTHQQLFDAVWAREFGDPRQLLRVHVTSLRRKLERDPRSPSVIVTDPGVGYRFESIES
jgi:two-component system KDP operon response regulator KdpE